MKKILLVILFVLNCGKTIQGNFDGEKPTLNYYRDTRSGLCFVQVKDGMFLSHSHVPCDAVSKFIK